MATTDDRAAIPASPVPSPCISVCTMNSSTGWCDGCLRTIDEIAGWGRLDEAARRKVWGALAERRAASGVSDG